MEHTHLTKKSSPRDSQGELAGFVESPTRCPYCHDRVVIEDDFWVACQQCLARHHRSCHEEHGSCASCGHEGRLVAELLERGELAVSRGSSILAVGALLPLLLALLGLAFDSLSNLGLYALGSLCTSLVLVFQAFHTRVAARRAQLNLALVHVVHLCICVQILYSLFLYDVVDPGQNLTISAFGLCFSLLTMIQAKRLRTLEAQ